MISLFNQDITLYAASDCTDFDDWCRELNKARESWLEMMVVAHLPKWVHRKATNPKTAQEAANFMRQEGFKLCENKAALDYCVTLKGRVVGRFKVCLQAPEPGKCRLCGEPLTMGAEKDTHGFCELMDTLKAKVQARQSIVRPEFN